MIIEPWLVVLIVALGAAVLLAGVRLSTREDAPPAGRRADRMAPVVPWLGSVLVVVLLVRGAFAGAAFVAAATLVHAVVARVRASAR